MEAGSSPMQSNSRGHSSDSHPAYPANDDSSSLHFPNPLDRIVLPPRHHPGRAPSIKPAQIPSPSKIQMAYASSSSSSSSFSPSSSSSFSSTTTTTTTVQDSSATPSRPSQTHGRAPARAPTPLQRQAKQLGLFFAGAAFTAASIAVTRRSILRRKLESVPKFCSGNLVVHKVDPGERGALAVQALGLATLNVMSFGVMLTGGIAWAFDLCHLRELRERTQAALRAGPRGTFSAAAEEDELEKMMGSILDRLGMQRPGEVAREDGGEALGEAQRKDGEEVSEEGGRKDDKDGFGERESKDGEKPGEGEGEASFQR